jgi:glutamate-1-semialdehyde 2,1-aminomutase
VWDVDGNEFVDLLLSYGSLPLGHAHAEVVSSVVGQMERGTMYGTCNTSEVELAEQICRMVPCAQLVRYANSGSEAICGAVRAARGYTGRSKVLKFEGHYHGWVDVLAVSNRPTLGDAGPAETPTSVAHSRGIPSGVVEDVVIAPWNDLEAVEAIVNADPEGFAAVILEPVVANNACTLPAPGFLESLRELCTRRGIVLIFDEIVTGFRLHRGGAQKYFGVVPDIAVFSKALGGGFPLSAFAGSKEVMAPVAENTVKHGGTYNGNPISAAAALATLRTLSEPGELEKMITFGEALMSEVERSARDFGVTCHVQGFGGMFQVLFGTDRGTCNYRDTLSLDMKRYAGFRDCLLTAGVHANSSGLACIFTSTAHTEADLTVTRAAIRKAMRAVS